MRISDWSSDVCSSDLGGYTRADLPLAAPAEATVWIEDIASDGPSSVLEIGDACVPPHRLRMAGGYDEDRKRAVQGKSVSVLVDLGGCGIIKKQTTLTTVVQNKLTNL